jgi:predicted SAM-dependent methyltransferase
VNSEADDVSESGADSRSALNEYLELSDDPGEDAPAWKKGIRAVLPERARVSLRIAGTDAFSLMQRSRINRLARLSPLQLHLGSGTVRKEGWVNLDLAGNPVDLAWNLARQLPFKSGSVDAIFHEHVLEHFPLGKGFALMRECHRLLKRGGVLRIGVPDAGRYLHSYCEDHPSAFLETNRPGRPTRMLSIQEIFFRYQHRCMYDLETLQFLCAAAGFGVVEQRPFGESRLIPCPDSDHRRSETLYAETVKED